MIGFWTGIWTSVLLVGWFFSIIHCNVPMIVLTTFLGLLTASWAGYIEGKKEGD